MVCSQAYTFHYTRELLHGLFKAIISDIQNVIDDTAGVAEGDFIESHFVRFRMTLNVVGSHSAPHSFSSVLLSGATLRL